ncbi:MAG: glycosyltransferase [Solirubrobacteraceae bacterium]
MRVLFACWPFEGHVFPQLSIALAMRERGHEVAFYTGPELRSTVEDQSVPVYGFRRVQETWREVREREREVGGRRQSMRVQHQAFRQWLVETIPGQVDDLRELIEDFTPDAIVADASMWGPTLILREAQPIPVALASPLIGAVIPGPDGPPPGSGLAPAYDTRGRAIAWTVTRATDLAARGLRRRLDQLRAGYGLAPLGCSVNAFLGGLPLYLVLSVPELDHNRWDLPAGVRYVGACTWHPPQEADASAWLDGLPTERPWVHVTDGTSHFQDPFVLRAAADGLAGAGVEVIITHGRERRPEEFMPDRPPANVHLTRWVSHAALLPRCAALVTTGGAGSTMAGLQAGLPLVMVPTTWDKPDNARRVAEAGAGLILPPRRCTPAGLRSAVEQVLGDPSYRLAAQRSARLLAAAPGPAGAAELIEGLAPARRPAAAQAGS